ncbi:MAG TPA: hypothetical protein VFQ21_00520 [Gemmatimonadota bacterium]|nr:hypothetical protein [Gemmatimonadota bacterium]
MEPQRAPTRAAAMLRRVVEISKRLVRGLKNLAIAAAVCVTGAWLVWLVDTPVEGTEGWIERIIALAVLLSPSAVLLFFVSGLRELASLPERVRTIPAGVRTEMASRPRSEARGALGLVAAFFRLARLVWGSREVLSPYAAVSIALRPAILLAALAASAAALVVMLASLIAIVIMSVA